MIRVFMDSSALFSAIVSSTGAARELVRLAVNEEIQLVISADVVAETRRNISRKAPELGPLLDRLLATIDFEVVPDPEKKAVRAAEAYVAQKDAFIPRPTYFGRKSTTTIRVPARLSSLPSYRLILSDKRPLNHLEGSFRFMGCYSMIGT